MDEIVVNALGNASIGTGKSMISKEKNSGTVMHGQDGKRYSVLDTANFGAVLVD